MTAVGFFVHPERESAASAAARLRGWLEERGATTRSFDGADTTDAARARTFVDGLDLVVAVGGDGTFLRAAHLASRGSCPVLGVKVGRLGFLTDTDPDRATELLGRALAGDLSSEERLAVVGVPEGASWTEPQWALNEVIVEKRTRHRIVRLALLVGDAYVTTFSGDGVIVATPTGSTAYSFAAGGPIVSPDVPCLVVTAVAPHMVFDRSLVVPADATVRLEVVGEEPGLLSADGRPSLELPVGSSVRIARAERPALLARGADSPTFPARIREKFGLPGDPVAPRD
ncbi:MAG: NAD(+)/NADH kinase [Actinomycetota bacterium]